MYLSRLILNPRSRRVRKEIADAYQMHRSLMRGFPDGLAEGEERVLFRVDTHPRAGVPVLLVQSLAPPGWAWLAEPGARDYLLPEDRLPPGVDDNPAGKPFDLELTPGQVLAFRLRANPTVKRRFNEKDHKRVGLYREEEQVEWLTRKGDRGGFRVLSAHASRETVVGGTIHREQETHKLNLLAVRFDGLLQVTDPARLRETVRQGVGSGKGLGFGLLSLAPA
jgi:CRISPR system Cascade subunit CasE